MSLTQRAKCDILILEMFLPLRRHPCQKTKKLSSEEPLETSLLIRKKKNLRNSLENISLKLRKIISSSQEGPTNIQHASVIQPNTFSGSGPDWFLKVSGHLLGSCSEMSKASRAIEQFWFGHLHKTSGFSKDGN